MLNFNYFHYKFRLLPVKLLKNLKQCKKPKLKKASCNAICRVLITPIFVVETFLANDPDFHNETPIHFLSHKELYEETIRQATAIFRKVRKFHEDRGNGDPSNYM